MKRLLNILLIFSFIFVSAYACDARQAEADETGANVPDQQSVDPGITQTRVLGEVAGIDAAGKRVIVKTEAGNIVTVMLDEKTELLRVPPGETSLEKAVKTTLAEIVAGDKLYVRGKVSDDRKSVPAQKLVVMPKADIDKKHDQERAGWQRRGVSGVISALNAEAREITIQARSREGAKPVIVKALESAQFRRYAPDSVKFSDAKVSSFAELKVGDQLRALGEKNAEGSGFTAEQVVSGSFRTVGGTVQAVSTETSEIKIEVLGSKQSLTIAVNSDSMLRRIPPQLAMLIVQRSQGGEPSQAAPQNSGRPSPQTGSPIAARDNPVGAVAPAGERLRTQSGGDFQDMIERMTAISLVEIKAGDVIAVSSTVGADPSRLTAITLIAGVDVVLAAMQRSGAPRRPTNLSTGLPGGVLDFGIGLP